MSDKEQVYVVISDVEDNTNRAYVGLVGGETKQFIFDLNFKVIMKESILPRLEPCLKENFTLVDRVDMFAGSNTVVLRVF